MLFQNKPRANANIKPRANAKINYTLCCKENLTKLKRKSVSYKLCCL